MELLVLSGKEESDKLEFAGIINCNLMLLAVLQRTSAHCAYELLDVLNADH